MSVIGSGFSVFLGLWCIYKSIASYLNRTRLLKKGDVAIAEVVDLIREESYDQEFGLSVSYWPVFEFRDAYNTLRTQKASSITDFEKFEIGETVPIVYDLDNEEKEIMVLTSVGQWKDILGFFVSGMIAIAIGLSIYVNNA